MNNEELNRFTRQFRLCGVVVALSVGIGWVVFWPGSGSAAIVIKSQGDWKSRHDPQPLEDSHPLWARSF